jgi:hypothetical protein
MATCDAQTIVNNAAISGFTKLSHRNKLDTLLQLLCDISNAPAPTSSPVTIGMPISDETSDITTDVSVFSMRAPYAMTVTEIYATLNTACVGNTSVDVNKNGATIIGGGLTIATSTAASTGTISVSVAKGDLISVDIIAVGATTGKGLKVWLIGETA